jgi:hypothetical protein
MVTGAERRRRDRDDVVSRIKARAIAGSGCGPVERQAPEAYR